MKFTSRRSEFDVTGTVDVTDSEAVAAAVLRELETFSSAQARTIEQAFSDFRCLYRGRYPGYLAVETAYHNEQHALDVTLAMARLIAAHEQSATKAERLGSELAVLGVLAALFHDAGYVRKVMDRRVAHGAAYTSKHIARSARFLESYLPTVRMGKYVGVIRKLLRFTGYGIVIERIFFDNPKYRVLGSMLGTADLMAQMADRCYLEKCRDRLYDEFIMAGYARPENERANNGYAFLSRQDMLQKTPDFMRTALYGRLEVGMGGLYHLFESYFVEGNLYYEAVIANLDYLEKVIKAGDFGMLRRRPPQL